MFLQFINIKWLFDRNVLQTTVGASLTYLNMPTAQIFYLWVIFS